jgi:hypothetical protein
MQTNLLTRSSKETSMSDFEILSADFSATSVKVVAHTTKAQQRIWGGVSCEIPKSKLPEFYDMMLEEGFSVDF